jgi:hypothetical protein
MAYDEHMMQVENDEDDQSAYVSKVHAVGDLEPVR